MNQCQRYNPDNDDYMMAEFLHDLVLCYNFLSNVRRVQYSFNDDWYQGYNQNNQVAQWRHGQNASTGSHRQSKASRRRENQRKIAAATQKQPEKSKSTKKLNCKLTEAVSKKVDSSNKGFKLMVKMGYESGKGLGKSSEGVLEPIPLKVKKNRKGLGIEKETNAQQLQGGNLKKENVGKQAPTPLKQSSLKLAVGIGENIVKTAKTEVVSKAAEKCLPAEKLNNPPAHRPHFCFKNQATAQQIRAIAYHFRNEIKMLHLRLNAEEATQIESEQELTLAKVWVENNKPITSVIFEFIRSEIIGWIGTFQHQQLDTPIFNSMTNEQDHIRIVCENLYAYQCLQICIPEVAQTYNRDQIYIQRLPTRASQIMYCFDAIYEAIIYDPDLFLTQVKLHKKQLRSQFWIIVEHEVLTEKRETHFTFLLDEYSALQMDNDCNNKLFICMQTVKFINRGRIPLNN